MKAKKDLNVCYIKNPSHVFKKIGRECIIVPVKQKADEIECIYTLNDVACRIWELIDGKKSVHAIGDIIVDEFAVSEEAARSDLLEFITKLDSIGAIRTE